MTFKKLTNLFTDIMTAVLSCVAVQGPHPPKGGLVDQLRNSGMTMTVPFRQLCQMLPTNPPILKDSTCGFFVNQHIPRLIVRRQRSLNFSREHDGQSSGS